MPHHASEPAALLGGLTAPQREAVVTTEGALLVLAGPGSGKTRVITRRVAYLLSLGVPAWQILALTFTNKAAGEMRERVERLLDDRSVGAGSAGGRGLTITTFHALCARLLRRYAPLMEGAPRWGITGDYSIYDADDQQALMKKVIADLGLSTSNWPVRSVLASISGAKNELLDAEGFAARAQDFHSKAIARLYGSYEKGLRAANAVDFDDLLTLSVRLLRENAEVRAQVQGRWKYLMIDEYQDTNRAQFVLGTLLVGSASGSDAPEDDPLPGAGLEAAQGGRGSEAQALSPNVCVVGDPDQSIYGWRGADIANILDFEQTYPGAKVIALGENFRSTGHILAAADALIRNNKRRRHKPLFTQRVGGARPQIVLCRDEHHEAELVVDWVRRLRAKGVVPEAGDAAEERGGPQAPGAGDGLNWKDFAVFYRNNALSRVMEDRLRAQGIPYVIVRGTAFYQREEVKDAVAYLRLLANPADEVSLRRIVNKPARKIGAATVEKLADLAAALSVPLWEAMRRVEQAADLGAGAVAAVRKFIEMVEGWDGGGTFLGASVPSSLADLVSRVLADSGLEAHYRLVREREGEDGADRGANLAELVNSARDFEQGYDAAADPGLDAPVGGVDPSAPPLLSMLRTYLERVSLVADSDAIDPAAGAVTLMTLHAAKGLEFPAVAMIGLEEGLLPSARAIENDPGEPEEERRLCFVGITRAMSALLITSAKYRSVRGLRERSIPSRFLRELPQDNVTLSDQSDAWDAPEDPGDALGDYEGGPSAARLGKSGMLRALQGRAGGAAASSGRPGGTSGSGPAPGARRTIDDPQYPVGSKVRHPQFGLGTVREVSGVGVNRRAIIAFAQAGTKTLVLQYARLERV